MRRGRPGFVAIVLFSGCVVAPTGSASPDAVAVSPSVDQPPAPVPNADDTPAPPSEGAPADPDPALLELLQRDPALAEVISRAETHRLQMLVTPLGPDGEAPTITYRFRVGDEYVFTASAIKTFAAVLALLEIQRTDDLTVQTPVAWCKGPFGREDEAKCPAAPTADSTNLEGGVATLGHEIRKMQLVSNNAAFNHLYDFVGHETLRARGHALGFESLELRHRMGEQFQTGRKTPPMVYFPTDAPPVTVPGRVSTVDQPATQLPGIEVGIAYIGRGKRRFERPRDFSNKNHVSLEDMHRMLASLVRPELDMSVDLGLSAAHRTWLLDAMTTDPVVSTNPRYRGSRYADHRYELLWHGVAEVVPEDAIRYVNKAGRAYGFHVENAYIEDTRSGRAFLVTVAIYVNDNGVVGDDEYEYEEVSRPFFRRLGAVLAQACLTGSPDGPLASPHAAATSSR